MFFYFFLFFFSKIFSVQEADRNLTGQLFQNSPLAFKSCLSYKREKVIEKISFRGSALFFIGGLILKKKSVQYWGMPFIPSCSFLGIGILLKKYNNKIDYYIENSLIVMNYAYQESVKNLKNKHQKIVENNKRATCDGLINLMIKNEEIEEMVKFYCHNNNMTDLKNITEEDCNGALLKIEKEIDIQNFLEKITLKFSAAELQVKDEERNPNRMAGEE